MKQLSDQQTLFNFVERKINYQASATLSSYLYSFIFSEPEQQLEKKEEKKLTAKFTGSKTIQFQDLNNKQPYDCDPTSTKITTQTRQRILRRRRSKSYYTKSKHLKAHEKQIDDNDNDNHDEDDDDHNDHDDHDNHAKIDDEKDKLLRKEQQSSQANKIQLKARESSSIIASDKEDIINITKKYHNNKTIANIATIRSGYSVFRNRDSEINNSQSTNKPSSSSSSSTTTIADTNNINTIQDNNKESKLKGIFTIRSINNPLDNCSKEGSKQANQPVISKRVTTDYGCCDTITPEKNITDDWVLLDADCEPTILSSQSSSSSISTNKPSSTISLSSSSPVAQSQKLSIVREEYCNQEATLSDFVDQTSSELSESDNQNQISDEEEKELYPTEFSRYQLMALDENDIDLIRASWVPVRKDPEANGILLFRGLFTKFPQYLSFFPSFSDLDIDNLHENKRLLRHATKVIDTVTFVVDSIGNEILADQLNEALVQLVKGHLKRRVGLSEFRNLGIVLIDFICDVTNRRGVVISNLSSANQHRYHHRHDHDEISIKSTKQHQESSNSHSVKVSDSVSSETMTGALDKLRNAPSSILDDDQNIYLEADISTKSPVAEDGRPAGLRSASKEGIGSVVGGPSQSQHNEPLIDTNALVASWTRLYGVILDLVKREEGTSAAGAQSEI